MNRSGFSLIELCIVLIISGLLLAAGLKAFNVYITRQRVEQTYNRLEEIKDALDDFVAANGHYPCPSQIDAAPNTPGFGKVTDCDGAAPGGTSDVNGRGGRKVRIGGLPVRTLAISDSYSTDGWDHRFTYAVTRDLAQDAGTFNPQQGAITIDDINGNTVVAGTAHYALISHGPDGKGAYATGGRLYAACASAPGKDQNNCGSSSALFTASDDRSTANGVNHFDDFVLFETKAEGLVSSGTWCGSLQLSGYRGGIDQIIPPLGCPPYAEDEIDLSVSCGGQPIKLTCEHQYPNKRTILCPSGFKAMVLPGDFKVHTHEVLEYTAPEIDGASSSESITCIKQ
jgi:prepilin-type N-terminal cleavage/methylation domain-containing protein